MIIWLSIYMYSLCMIPIYCWLWSQSCVDMGVGDNSVLYFPRFLYYALFIDCMMTLLYYTVSMLQQTYYPETSDI